MLPRTPGPRRANSFWVKRADGASHFVFDRGTIPPSMDGPSVSVPSRCWTDVAPDRGTYRISIIPLIHSCGFSTRRFAVRTASFCIESPLAVALNDISRRPVAIVDLRCRHRRPDPRSLAVADGFWRTRKRPSVHRIGTASYWASVGTSFAGIPSPDTSIEFPGSTDTVISVPSSGQLD